MVHPITNVVGFDDAPFVKQVTAGSALDPAAPFGLRPADPVLIVGAICARTRLDGVVSGTVQRDGLDATERMIQLLENSQFGSLVRAVLLQGIAVAGFNVVDVHELAARLGVPVVVVVRRKPRLDLVKAALFRTQHAERKWSWLAAAGEMEPLDRVWVQRVGIGLEETRALLRATTLHGNIPEPLRLAHLIAGGVTTGKSRGRT